MIYSNFQLPARMKNINPSDESTKVGKFAEDQIRDELDHQGWIVFREDSPDSKMDLAAFHKNTGAMVTLQSRSTMSPKYRKIPYYDSEGLKQIRLDPYFKVKTGQTSSKRVKQKNGCYKYMVNELIYTRSTIIYVFPMFNPETNNLIIAYYKSHILKGTKFVTINTIKSYCNKKSTLTIQDHNLDLRKLLNIPEENWGIPKDYAFKQSRDYQLEQSSVNTFGQWTNEEIINRKINTGKSYF